MSERDKALQMQLAEVIAEGLTSFWTLNCDAGRYEWEVLEDRAKVLEVFTAISCVWDKLLPLSAAAGGEREPEAVPGEEELLRIYDAAYRATLQPLAPADTGWWATGGHAAGIRAVAAALRASGTPAPANGFSDALKQAQAVWAADPDVGAPPEPDAGPMIVDSIIHAEVGMRLGMTRCLCQEYGEGRLVCPLHLPPHTGPLITNSVIYRRKGEAGNESFDRYVILPLEEHERLRAPCPNCAKLAERMRSIPPCPPLTLGFDDE